MIVLLIEDMDDKIASIRTCIAQNVGEGKYTIVLARNLEEARRKIIGEIFDLIIFDIYLPLNNHSSSNVQDVSDDLILEFSKSKNYRTEAIAITIMKLDDIDNLHSFNSNGITVVNHSNKNEDWALSLNLKLDRVKEHTRYDFLVFCALEKERIAFLKADAQLGELTILKGLSCQGLVIDEQNGLCITPAKKGLVNMAIIAAKAIEVFQPKLVTMSGICAGVPGETNFLDLVVAEPCWEYQTGKFKDNKFRQEPYQSSINNSVLTELTHFAQSKDIMDKIKLSLYDTELKDSKILIGPMSSGSAVIASEEKMKEIGLQNRAMVALEMEMYSVYEAASQSLVEPLYFGAKAVVDLGNSSKGDKYHSTAAIISARFVVEFMRRLLPNI